MSQSNAKAPLTLGLMSGTSMDGIDVSLTRHGLETGAQEELLQHIEVKYPKALHARLLKLIKSYEASLEEITDLHFAVGEAFANAAEQAIKKAVSAGHISSAQDLTAIGSHGQTVYHHPSKRITLQLGEGSIIAARTGVTTVSDFRVADLAAGGEGAPLLPFYHRCLLGTHAGKVGGVAVQNLGGIANFTYLGPGGEIFSLDTGPASCLLDGAIHALTKGKQSFDKDGKLARSGLISKSLLKWLLSQGEIKKFVKKPAPKSTGRELFSLKLVDAFLKQAKRLKEPKENVFTTLTEFSVELMVLAYERFVFQAGKPLSEIVVAGGGSKNPFMLERLQLRLPQVKVRTLGDFGHNPQTLESQAFGFYALMALKKVGINVPTATGAKRTVVCGKISY